MAEEVLSLMRYFYEYNYKRAFRVSLRNGFLNNLYGKAKATMNNSSKFMIYLKRLYDFNQRRSIYLYRRHRYIALLMQECKKEVETMQEAAAKREKEEQAEQAEEAEQAKQAEQSMQSVETVKPAEKAALLIGINYKGTSKELYGCENDIYNTKKVLLEKYGFKNENILILTESAGKGNRELIPTYDNILKGIKWLVKKSDEGCGSLWFQYSGHGHYFRDQNGDEKDGYDECLVTSDNYGLADDELRSELINRIRADCKLFCLVDACHSGTMMDLEYKYNQNTRKMVHENKHSTKSNVWALSGCRDDQESADAEFRRNVWAGALTKNFLDILAKYQYAPKLDVLLRDLNNNLRRDSFTQKPQLTCSKNILPTIKFTV